MPALDIVIVNWNSRRYLARCIRSLARADQASLNLQSICVVDNASDDHSDAIEVPRNLPIEFIRNTCNLGFAAACNLGARQGRSEYLLFLNPDTELHSNSLTSPISLLEDPKFERVGICGIQMVDAEGRPEPCVSQHPSLRAFVFKAMGLTRLFPVACASIVLPPGYPGRSGQVDQVIGAFMLFRRSTFAALNGFDERYFVYYEDADISLRARRIGHVSYLLKEATAFHKGHGSSENVKAARLFYSLRSRLQYSKKHFTPLSYIATVLVTTTWEPLARVLQGAVTLSGSTLVETFQAYRALYRWMITPVGAYRSPRSRREFG